MGLRMQIYNYDYGTSTEPACAQSGADESKISVESGETMSVV